MSASAHALSSGEAERTAATGKGKHETALLRQQINDQLGRLLTQLEDLEALKDEFDADEYEETKTETVEQLRDFQAFLDKALKGDLTLVDEFGAAQLAIQAAVSDAFKTPEVIRMFASKQPDQLRVRLAQLQRDVKIKQISRELFNRQAVEILVALKKLGSELSGEEKAFLEQHTSSAQLETAVDSAAIGDDTHANIMSTASAQIQRAAK
jgi:hypothetical protein